MFEGSDPLVFTKENRMSPERILGILLLTILVVTVLLHLGGH